MHTASALEKQGNAPHEPRAGGEVRWGRLLNGNPGGDLSKVRRCLAKNRRGEPCMAPAMRNKSRCKFHGGCSTGARTAEGKARCRAARLQSGAYSREVAQARRKVREWVRAVRNTIALAEAKLLMMPEPTDASSALARCRAESAIQLELWALHGEITALLREKLAKPIALDSPEMTASAMATMQWVRLARPLVELGRAAVIGPGRTRFTG